MTQTITLLISSGGGPVECHQAVQHILRLLSQEAQTCGIDIDIAEELTSKTPKSTIIRLHSKGARELADRWVGTIKWNLQK